MVSSLAYTYSLKEGMYASKTLFSVCGGSSFLLSFSKVHMLYLKTAVSE
jgi:hypothetical protein